MAFDWIPDAALDPHPRLTWFTELCFDFSVLAFYRKTEILPPDYRLEDGTLVVSNHQRDADIPILTTVLCRRVGLKATWQLPFYASREDFFRRGFLADHLVHWARPARFLLAPLSLAWFFRIIRAEPMRRVREFTLLEAFGDLGLDERSARAAALNARGRREASLSQSACGNFWGLRRLCRAARGALAPGFRATVAAQLRHFANLLAAGRIVYIAPEGTISPDGRFGRLRAAPWLIARLADTPPPILPLALAYDPLAPGRLRVIVKIGKPLHGYNAKNRREFDAALKEEILKLYPLTASHAISRFLAAGPERFTTAEFARWLQTARDTLAAAGFTLDPLWDQTPPAELAERRLRWLARRKLLVRESGAESDTWRNCCPRDAQPDWRKSAGIVRYLDNALDDLTHAIAPDIAGELAP